MANDVNLAALWVPVMPETSKLAPEMRKAGEKAKQEFIQGFSSGGGKSPDQMGKEWGEQFAKSFNSTFGGIQLPRGLQDFMGSLGSETKLTTAQMKKFEEQAKKSWGEYASAAREATHYQKEYARLHKMFVDSQKDTAGGSVFVKDQARQAYTKYSEATQRATQHQMDFRDASQKLNPVLGNTAKGGKLAAAAIGGLAGAAATLGIEAVLGLAKALMRLAVEGFKLAIEGAKNLVQEVINIGDTFDSINGDIIKFTDATGESLESLQDSAARVFGQLDVDGKNVGQTMAQLHQRLDITGEPLERMTYLVEELGGRFGSLDVASLTAALEDFGVSGENADKTLASWLQSARAAGTPLDDVVKTLGGASNVLAEFGLDAEQAGAFVAQLEQQGITAGSAIDSLGRAQKEFSERGLSFSEGINLAANRIRSLVDAGEKAKAQQLAEDLFGSRKWVDALTTLETLSGVLDSVPGQFSASASSVDEFIENTTSLKDKWQEVKNAAYAAFEPVGTGVLDKVKGGLEKFKGWLDANWPKVVETIRGFGNSFIDALPKVQSFAVNFLRITAPIAQAFMFQMGLMTHAFGQLMQTFAQFLDVIPEPLQHLIPGYKGLADGLDDAAKSALDMSMDIAKVDVMGPMNDAADAIENIDLNTQGAHDTWNAWMDDVKSNNPFRDGTAFGGIGNSLGAGLFGPGGMAGPGGLPGILSGQPGPGASSSPGSWQNMILPGMAVQPSGNAEQWRPAVESVVRQYGPLLGIAGDAVPLWVDAIVKQIESESGGDPNSVNPNDSNGRGGTQRVAGLLNFLESTYNANNISGRSYMDPIGQIAAVLPYVLSEYGTDNRGGPNWIGRGHGFQSGGTVEGPGFRGLAPNSRDTVPIWAEGGEEVINRKSAEKFRPLLKLLNASAFETGGTVGWSPAQGVGAGTDIRQGAKGFPPWVYQLAAQFGLQASTYAGHQDGFGIDWWGPVASMQRFAEALVSAGGMPQVIWANPSTGQKIGMANGQMVGPGTSQPGYYRDDWAGHTDHVHTRWPPSAYGGGVGAPGGDYYGYPSMPMGLGVSGYGGDWEKQRRNETALRDAQQRLDDMDWEIAEKQRDIEDLKKERATAAAGEEDLLYGTRVVDQEELNRIDRQLAQATHDLEKMTRERGDQMGKISDAERKLYQGTMTEAEKVREPTGVEAFKELGGGLLSGIASDLGFGDIFGKPPWEWGIFKLFAGLSSWGIGTANAWSEHIGAGKTGLTGFQALPGFESGASSGFGGLLDSMVPGASSLFPNTQAVTTGPNIAVNPAATVHGSGMGQPPGPAVDNSINITNNGPNQSDYNTWQQAQNTRTAPVMSSMPKPMG